MSSNKVYYMTKDGQVWCNHYPDGLEVEVITEEEAQGLGEKIMKMRSIEDGTRIRFLKEKLFRLSVIYQTLQDIDSNQYLKEIKNNINEVLEELGDNI